MRQFLLLLTLPLLAQLGFATNIPGHDGEQSSSPTTGFENGHEWVDLGLPSGTLWATCNIRADSPEEYGVYFPWGDCRETSTKIDRLTWGYYLYYQTNVGISKYNTNSNQGPVDNKTQLELCDDAAHVHWGGNWHIPTEEQWKELMEYCTVEFYEDGEVTSHTKAIYTGPNGQSIVLPGNHYWSSTLCEEDPENAMYYYVLPLRKEHSTAKLRRTWTIAIRPVTSHSDATGDENSQLQEGLGSAANGSGPGDKRSSSTTGSEKGHEWVNLGLPSGTKWATCNVGAYTRAEPGRLFAWGETRTKLSEDYTWEKYRFRTSGDDDDNVCFKKYNTDKSHGRVDNRTQLELGDDAAHVEWGGKWRIPTREQWVELLENCTWEASEEENQWGTITFTGPNGQSIVLPATYWDYGYYWSSSLDTEGPQCAFSFSFRSFQRRPRVISIYRRADNAIRPVIP